MSDGTEATHVNATTSCGEAELTDRDLVACQVREAKQDPQAFEALYRGHVDVVYRYCYRRLSSSEVAADATSKVFIKAFSSIHHCDEDRFRSWLFAIAHNVLIDEYRSRRHEEGLEAAREMVSGDPSPEDLVLQDEDRVSVVRLLSFLTPDQRQIVELRLAGLNGNEIATVLGRSRGSVDTAQSRAITRLRDVFARERATSIEPEARHVSA